MVGPHLVRDEDPIAKGLIQDDLLHLNEDGQQRLADTLAEAGLETSEPPN
jgi:lysophospholipase L1-like esterase